MFKISLIDLAEFTRPTELSFLLVLVFFSLIKSGLELRVVLNFFNLDADKLSVCFVPKYTLYRKYSPPFYFCPFRSRCQQVNSRLGEFECLKLFLNCVRANSRQLETVCKGRRERKTWDKNNPLYSIT